MNILIITGHPAQIHNFRLIKKGLELKGHSVYWLASSKDISDYLLKHYGIDYFKLEKPKKSFLSKIISLVKNTKRCIRIIKEKKIDLVLSRVSPYGSIAAYILNVNHIALADTESSGIYDTFFSKLTSQLITSTSYKRQLTKDQIRFKGNIELFYLHPNRYIPRNDAHQLLGIRDDERFVILRFVSWDAYHDKGLSGFSDENKVKAVKEFSKHAKVFISSEKSLPDKLEDFRINIPPERMHDILASAYLFFGESATMASESAVLGTPAIYLDKVGRGYTDEEQSYGLLHHFKSDTISQEDAIKKGVEILNDPLYKDIILVKRNRFLQDKIDPTAFMLWFINDYPHSRMVMKQNPDYQNILK